MKKFRDFESAREFVRKLKLKTTIVWWAYTKSGNKPDDLPANPHKVYKNDWKGWGDWLGTGNVASKKKAFRSFKEAREFVRSLNLKGQKDWLEYCKSGNKPHDITSSPEKVYKIEWQGSGDWLGTGRVHNKDKPFRSYKEAKEFVRSLEIKSVREWEEYCKSGNKPDDIPSNPEISYKKQQTWEGWGDFLGNKRQGSSQKGNFRSFDESKKFVKKLGLKSQKEWIEYCQSGNKPDDIPSSPYQIFENKGWIGLGDWLGTGRRTRQKNHNGEWRPFKEAREFVRSLGLKGYDEWYEYCKSGNKPDDIPAKPWHVYNEWNTKF